MRDQICTEYGIAKAQCDGVNYEIDHLISLEIGGSVGPGMGGTTTISAWEPGKHFGTANERSKIAVDYYIESLGGGITRLRLVQSGFGPEADWDDEFFEKTKTGRVAFLKKLKELLEK